LPLLVLVAGCGGKSSGSQGTSDSDAGGTISYPVKTDVTITWWQDFNNNVSPLALRLSRYSGKGTSP
jgi:hypothetical protein